MGQHVTAHFLEQKISELFYQFWSFFQAHFGLFFKAYFTVIFIGHFTGPSKMVLLYYIYALYV